jgi:hypothetical protein
MTLLLLKQSFLKLTVVSIATVWNLSSKEILLKEELGYKRAMGSAINEF